MKLKVCYFLAFTALGLMACTNDDEPATVDTATPKTIQLTLSGPASTTTKAAPGGPTDILPDQTPGVVTSVDVYITDVSNVILRAARIANPSDQWTKLTSTDGLKFINVPGTSSKVYVFGNLGAASLADEGTNISTVALTKTLDQQQGVSSLLYLGDDQTITPSVPEPTPPDATVGQTFVAHVDLVPIVSRFQITKIAFANTGNETVTKTIGGLPVSATVAWTGFSGQVDGIYMNNFYNSNTNRAPSDLKANVTAVSNIVGGTWLFTADDFATIASYSNYTGGAYVALALPTTGKCYAFNFFPEGLSSSPKLHLRLSDLSYTGLTSTDANVFNPSLVTGTTGPKYLNITGFTTNGTTPVAFAANKLYNLEITIKPYFMQDDITHVQYNVICTVTVQPWSTETLIPTFEPN